jgi:hypothetical protein
MDNDVRRSTFGGQGCPSYKKRTPAGPSRPAGVLLRRKPCYVVTSFFAHLARSAAIRSATCGVKQAVTGSRNRSSALAVAILLMCTLNWQRK